jgi:hypothetical protein
MTYADQDALALEVDIANGELVGETWFWIEYCSDSGVSGAVLKLWNCN